MPHLDTGTFEPVCFLAGFARGLSILGDYAVVGVSSDRNNNTFKGLELGDRLAQENVNPFVGLAIVNLSTGAVEHRMTLKGVISEIYDCVQIPGVRSPAFFGLKSPETRLLLRPAPLGQLPI